MAEMRANGSCRCRTPGNIVAALAACLAVLVMGCERGREPVIPSTPRPETPRTTGVCFTEAARDSGVQFTYRNGQEANHCSILESLGGGVGILDFDGDGWMDLCIPGGGILTDDQRIEGLPTGLLRNLGDFRFAAVEEPAGVKHSPYYSHGAAVADYNNDGFSDILVTGYGGVLLWTNMGDGTFIETSRQAGIDADRWSTSAGWGDFNGDGCLDLYVANYVNWSFQNHPVCPGGASPRDICSPKTFDPLPDYVYFSNGDGTFRDASEEAGLRVDGKGLGVVLADFDNDGDLDAYVGNDTTPNFLYLNDGEGHFDEAGLLRGVALDERGVSNGSMGVDVCDYNGDGWLDIWVANYEHETFALYRNEGQGYFLPVSQSAGVTGIGQLFVGFGTACADFDRDGDEDIVVANGHVIKHTKAAPRRQLPLFLENSRKRFERVTFPAGTYFSTDHEGRGLAVGDLDNDGDLDLAISQLNEPMTVLRNDCRSGSWFSVRLIGVESNRDAIGSRLTLRTTNGKMFRQIKGGSSYLSTNDSRVFWGLANGVRVEELTINWPSGRTQAIAAPEMNRVLTVVESVDDEAE